MTRLADLAAISKMSAALDGLTDEQLDKPVARFLAYPADAQALSEPETIRSYKDYDTAAVTAQRARRAVMQEPSSREVKPGPSLGVSSLNSPGFGPGFFQG